MKQRNNSTNFPFTFENKNPTKFIGSNILFDRERKKRTKKKTTNMKSVTPFVSI